MPTGGEGNFRDILLSVLAGGLMMAGFASVVGGIMLLAWALARVRQWWEERSG